MDGHDTSALYRIVDAARQAQPPVRSELLAALALVVELRAELDGAEQDLIDLARTSGGSWREIAVALGLGSRQAAEQRWLRRRGVTGTARQQSVDTSPDEVAVVRARATALLRTLAIRRDGGLPAGRVGLARQTLAIAVAAPPGAMYDLVSFAIEDLRQTPQRELGRAAGASLRRLVAAVRARLDSA